MPRALRKPMAFDTWMNTYSSMMGTTTSSTSSKPRRKRTGGDPRRVTGERQVGAGVPSGRAVSPIDAPAGPAAARRSTPSPARSPTSACRHPLLVDVAREAIAAGDPDSAPARADALRRALLQPGDQRHRRAAAHQPRPGAAGRRTAGAGDPTSSSTWPPASAARATATSAGCWPGCAAPRRRSSSTTTPPPCCSCWPPWPRGREVRGQPRRERRDRRRLPGARGDGAVGRPPRRRRHHQPHPPAPTTGRAVARPAPTSPSC